LEAGCPPIAWSWTQTRQTELLWAGSRFSYAPLGNLGPSLQVGIDTVTASDHVRVLGVTFSAESGEARIKRLFDVLLLATPTQTGPTFTRRWVGLDTRTCVRYVTRGLLQCCSGRSAEVHHHRQTPACAERCSTSRHRHSEVRPWLGTSSSWQSTCTGSTFPNEFSSSSVWQFVGVYNAELPSTWWTTVRPSLTSSLVSRQHLRSASRRQLVVPRHRLSTFGRRVFAVAGPMSWYSLPNSLRESACDDNTSDDCFKDSLKTFLFSGYWRTERSRGVYDSALYKSTFTYLLTYYWWSIAILILHCIRHRFQKRWLKRRKSPIRTDSLSFNALARCDPFRILGWTLSAKTAVFWLPVAEEIMAQALFVLMCQTDGQTDWRKSLL